MCTGSSYWFFKFLSFVCLLNLHVTCDVLKGKQINEEYKNVSFEEVNKLKDNPNYLIIDVRESCEFAEEGSIPVQELENALTKLPASDFKKTYGKEKPDKNFNIIFSCESGKRSQLAQEKAISLGYTNVSKYPGSWLDWITHIKKST